jgi:hypothetical protein
MTGTLTVGAAAPGTDTRTRRLFVVLVAVHVLIAAGTLLDPALRTVQYAARSDAARLFQIATHGGTPYVDFAVEYPPVLVVVAKALAFGSFETFLSGVIVVSITCDLVVAWLLRRTWGTVAAVAYLVISAPMLAVGLPRLDWFPTALAVTAMALALAARRQRAAGATLAVAALAKLWPVFLVPLWIARGRWRALVAFAVTGAVGVAAWISWAGTAGIRQVLEFRGAHGWHVESLPGNAVALFTHDVPRFEKGAWRIGSPPPAITLGLVVVGAIVLVVLTVFLARAGARRVVESDAGAPALAAVGLALVIATLLSPQFLVWLLPWAAISYAYGERRPAALVLAAVLATVVAASAWPASQSGALGAQLLYLTRNLLLVAVVVSAARSTRTRTVESVATPV